MFRELRSAGQWLKQVCLGNFSTRRPDLYPELPRLPTEQSKTEMAEALQSVLPRALMLVCRRELANAGQRERMNYRLSFLWNQGIADTEENLRKIFAGDRPITPQILNHICFALQKEEDVVYRVALYLMYRQADTQEERDDNLIRAIEIAIRERGLELKRDTRDRDAE